MIADSINFAVSESDDAVWLEVSENFPPPHLSLFDCRDSGTDRWLLLSLDDQEVLNVGAIECLWVRSCNLPSNSHIMTFASRRVLGEAPRASLIFSALVLGHSFAAIFSVL